MPKKDIKKQEEVKQKEAQRIELELDLSHFTNADFEVLLEWQTSTGQHELKEVFDLLDKIVVGGFRSLPFVNNAVVIPQILSQITDIAKGKTSKN